MNTTIEPAAPSDTQLLLPLLIAQYEEHELAYSTERLERAIAAVFAREDRGQFLVARHPTEGVVGLAYVSFAWPLEVADKVLWLEELYVLPAHRGGGLGEHLLRAVIELARRSGCRTLDLEVEQNHERVAAFYARHGFWKRPRSHWTLSLDTSG
jgi:GNAT superfamily N-acetyltransferase